MDLNIKHTMIRKFSFLSVLTVAVVFMTSCSKDDNDASGSNDGEGALISFGKAVLISHSDASKTKKAIMETELPSDGNLGIFAFKTGDATNTPYINNNSLSSYDKTTNSAFLGTPDVYYWPGAESLDFYAYFYKGEGVTVSDVTNILYQLQDGWENQVDFLYSEMQSRAKTTNPASSVPLTFKHAMAWVSFNIKSTTNPGAVLSSVKFNDSKIATFSLKDNAFSSVGGAGDIVLQGLAKVKEDGSVSDKSLSSLVFPTTTNWNKAITVTVNDVVFAPITLSGDQLVKFEAGKKYSYTIEYNGSKIEFSKPTIEDWLDGDITNGVISVQ